VLVKGVQLQKQANGLSSSLPLPISKCLQVSLYHSNRKQGFTLELEEGRVVIEGFVNEINNKLCVVPKALTLRIKK
jgi:hypothetical protein